MPYLRAASQYSRTSSKYRISDGVTSASRIPASNIGASGFIAPTMWLITAAEKRSHESWIIRLPRTGSVFENAMSLMPGFSCLSRRIIPALGVNRSLWTRQNSEAGTRLPDCLVTSVRYCSFVIPPRSNCSRASDGLRRFASKKTTTLPKSSNTALIMIGLPCPCVSSVFMAYF